MSGDINLRQTIRKSAIEEAKLLVSIGSAQMQEQLRKKFWRTQEVMPRV